MISAPAARSQIDAVIELAHELGADVELHCACRCRCHSPIGWNTDTPIPCRGSIDLDRLDCAYGCRGERGCDLEQPIPLRRAHV